MCGDRGGFIMDERELIHLLVRAMENYKTTMEDVAGEFVSVPELIKDVTEIMGQPEFEQHFARYISRVCLECGRTIEYSKKSEEQYGLCDDCYATG